MTKAREEINFSIAETINQKFDNSLLSCFQCVKCTDGCPLAFAMDTYPHEIIRLLLLGFEERALKSTAIWVCSSCYTCTTRCPNEVDVAGIIDYLKQEAHIRGIVNPIAHDVHKFHESFMKNIERTGRIHEPLLLASYFADRHVMKSRYKKGLLKDDIKTGIALLTKRRMKLVPDVFREKR